MSEDVDDRHDRRVTDAVAGIIDARAPIDQTKGMLMLIYGIGEVEAFELLRAEARRTRTSMQALARQFREDVAALDDRQAIPSRAVLDRLLTTAHERITEPRQ